MKNSKNRILLIVLLAVVLAVNVAVCLLPYRTAHPDVSGSGVYVLSDSTKEMLSGITQNAEIIYYAKNPDADLRSFVSLFKTDRVKVTVTKPTADDTDQTIAVKCGDKTRTIALTDLYYYYSSVSGEILSASDYSTVSAYLSKLDTSSSEYSIYMTYYGPEAIGAYFLGDTVISSTLRNLTAKNAQTVYVYGSLDWYVTMMLWENGIIPVTLTTLENLPTDGALWLIPPADLDDTEKAKLSTYLDGGGRLFLTTDYAKTDLPNLLSVLSAYGLSTSSSSSSSSSSMSSTFYAKTGSHAIADATSGSIVASYAHAIKITDTADVTATELLKTSTSGGYVEQTDGETVTDTGCYAFGATATKGDSRVVWIGMQFTSTLDSYSGGSNSTFASNCIAWLNDTETLPTVGELHEIPSALLNVKVSTFIIWIVIFVFLIPLTLVAVACVTRYVRNKKS